LSVLNDDQASWLMYNSASPPHLLWRILTNNLYELL